MGAGAAVARLYKEGYDWFKLYIDRSTFETDFDEIDKGGTGEISFSQIHTWMVEKAEKDEVWKMFTVNSQILHAAVKNTDHDRPGQKGFVNISGFKLFLVNMYVAAILWQYFETSASWVEGDDGGKVVAGKMIQLNLEKFRLAVKLLCSFTNMEELPDSEIKDAFQELDKNDNGNLNFIEVGLNFRDDTTTELIRSLSQ